MIPNITHFVFGLDENFGGKPFSFVHFLAVYSAWRINQPDTIFLHYHYEPRTVWWKEARKYVQLNKVEIPNEIFGNPITHFAHKADVVRLQQLRQHGGVYLDLDVICLRPFTALLKHDMVLGTEAGTGLCNAVILTNANSEFLNIWYDGYKGFDKDVWNHHSVVLPWQLSRNHPDLIHVEGPYSFFYPVFREPASAHLWSEDVSLGRKIGWMYRRTRDHLRRPENFRIPGRFIAHTLRSRRWHGKKLLQSYCVHLWEQLWWDRYLKNMTPSSVDRGRGNLSKVLRSIFRELDFARLAALDG